MSLFAGDGIRSHYYIYCDSDGNLCSGAPSNWGAAGGTSFATPIFAGIQALIAQKTGQSWGNPSAIFYQLAAKEYGASGNRKCSATKGNKAASSCVSYDLEEGDNDVDCTGPMTVTCLRGNIASYRLQTPNTKSPTPREGVGILRLESARQTLRTCLRHGRPAPIERNCTSPTTHEASASLFHCAFHGRSTGIKLVPLAGLEPARCRQQQILSLPRLPFRHRGT